MIFFQAQGTNHPVLYTDLFFTSKPYWIHSQPIELKNRDILDCKFKFQHVEPWESCEVCETEIGLTVRLKTHKRAITPGQFAVFSKEYQCLGSAQILNSGVSDFSYYYLKNYKLDKELETTKMSAQV